MTENIYWTINATIKEGCLEGLKEHIVKMVEITKTEEGALNYEFWLNDDSTRIFIHERYVNSEAAIAHIQNVGPHLGPFLDAVEMDPIVILGNLSDEGKAAFAPFGASYTQDLNGFTN
jgi:quinol monooxygenase YgiN